MVSDESIKQAYRRVPICLLPKSEIPTALIIKAELGLLQKQSNLSSSSFVISPVSYIEIAVFVPMGNPQTVPRISAHPLASPMSNIAFKGYFSNFPIL